MREVHGRVPTNAVGGVPPTAVDFRYENTPLAPSIPMVGSGAFGEPAPAVATGIHSSGPAANPSKINVARAAVAVAFRNRAGASPSAQNPPARKSDFTGKVLATVKAHRVRITASLLLIALIAILAAR